MEWKRLLQLAVLGFAAFKVFGFIDQVLMPLIEDDEDVDPVYLGYGGP